MQFTLNVIDNPFDLFYTLESGQVFRWEVRNGWWYGIIDREIVRMKQEGPSLTCVSSSDELNTSFVHWYFRLDEDLKSILATIMKDEVISGAVQKFYGLRLIRQPVWECLISFIIATNSNIPRIKKMISNLCERYGMEVEFEGLHYRLFPSPAALAGAPLQELEECGLGYRARFVKHVATAVHEGSMDLSALSILDYDEARDTLLENLEGRKSLLGIGPKVSDCVLLFSCGKDGAFPIDVWIARAIANYYPRLLEPRIVSKLNSHESGKKVALTLNEYDSIGSAMRGYFGEHAGLAQQYLFHLARSAGLGRKID